LELVDDRLGAILSLGVRNDVVKLVPSSIYRGERAVAANFGRDARRSEVEKNTGARGLVSHAVATSPALIRQQWGVMATQWKG
jgi:hypothetical protein